MENRTKYSLLKSAAINAVILAAVLAATHMMYETNDDYAIASRIVDGYPEVNFVNYYLCLILVKIQAAVPSLNAYVIFMILGSYVSFTCILKLIMDRTDQKIIYIASALVIDSVISDPSICRSGSQDRRTDGSCRVCRALSPVLAFH